MNVGLVGCGNIGSLHASILSDMHSDVNNDTLIKSVAFTDFDISKATDFSKKYMGGMAHSYSSLEEMLDNEDLQVVHICTPHYLHVPMAKMCLDRNINVLMEKPPAMNREEFETLKLSQSKSHSKLGIVFQNRYNPTTQIVDDLLQSNKIGSLNGARTFVTWNRGADYYTKSGWRGKLSTEGGGVLINQSIHTLDLLCRWLGPCTGVRGSVHNHHLQGITEVEDTLEASLSFSDKTALFYATTGYVEDSPVIIELHGSQGKIRIESDTVTLHTGDKECIIKAGSLDGHGGKTYWGAGHEACIRDFYNCIKKGSAFQNELLSVEKTMDAMMKIYENCR